MSFVYKGLKEKLEHHTVTDEQVDRQLEQVRQQNPRIAVITDRPTQNGDEVVLDYAGFCDGEQFTGGTAQNQTLVLGSGTFIPGFEEQLLDKVVEEQVSVKVTFPTEYHAAELAGKEAEFRCVIHQIRVKSEYALDDTFAKEVGRCETFEEMRKKMREGLQAYTDQRAEMELQDKLLRQASDSLDYQPTEEERKEAVDAQMENLGAQLAQQNLTVEMYCQFMNTTEEKLRQEAEPAALASIRAQKTVDRIVLLEGLSATEQELAQALEVVCRQNNMTLEQIQPYRDEAFEEALKNSILTGKVMDLIRAYAVITEE